MAEPRYRRYTETELNHIRRYPELSNKVLGEQLDRTTDSVRRVRLRHHIPFKKRKRRKVLSTWVSTLISNQELEGIEKLVKDGKYSSRGAFVRGAAKIVIAIENNNIEQIPEILREARIDILIESSRLEYIADVLREDKIDAQKDKGCDD